MNVLHTFNLGYVYVLCIQAIKIWDSNKPKDSNKPNLKIVSFSMTDEAVIKTYRNRNMLLFHDNAKPSSKCKW